MHDLGLAGSPHMVLQVVLGQALHGFDELLPSSSLPFDDIAAAVLLVFFGIKTLQVTLPKQHTIKSVKGHLFCAFSV